MRIIGAEERAALEADPAKVERSRFAPYLRAFLAARSRFAEEQLAAAIERGVRQYVLLGAGLDTFAYRDPYSATGLRVFEVDHPSTQAWKRERLREGGIAIPSSVVFVPVDFERQTLAASLGEAGFDPGSPAMFAWLGVTMYLTAQGFEDTLDFIASMPAGSSVVFDYALSRSQQGLFQRVVFELVAARVRAAGEPWRTTFVPAELVRRMEAKGFVHVQDLDDARLNERYFRDRTDGLRVGSLARMLSAEVGPKSARDT